MTVIKYVAGRIIKISNKFDMCVYVCMYTHVHAHVLCVHNGKFTSEQFHSTETGDKQLSSVSPQCERCLRTIASSDNSRCNTANTAAFVLGCVNSQLDGDKSGSRFSHPVHLSFITNDFGGV